MLKRRRRSEIMAKNISRKVLVIGGAGYIGSHIVDELCNQGCDVTVFDNLSSGFKENLDVRAKLVVGSILDVTALEKVFSKEFDVVMHFAALKSVGESMMHPEKYSETNIVGTLNILNTMAKYDVKSIIFSSSAAVYGLPKYLPMDEKHPLNPESFYGFTKLEIERFLEWYSKIHGIHFAALRYFNAAGYTSGKCKEKNPGNLLPIVMEVAAGSRKEVQVFGNDYDTPDGTGVRDYIHVLDLADAHIKAMNYILNNKKNIIVNLSTQKGSSVLELIQKTEEITGKKIRYKIVGRRAGDTATVVASSGLANKLLGWKPEHSDIDTIIRSMWDVYKS
jgi:UDP-glucose 4-epimerase